MGNNWASGYQQGESVQEDILDMIGAAPDLLGFRGLASVFVGPRRRRGQQLGQRVPAGREHAGGHPGHEWCCA